MVDNITIGDNVWVTQGKTDHMATFLGEPRISPEDETETEAETTDEVEVMIRWTTTGTKSYVSASAVRPVVMGERRRRVVVNHYKAVPSQRPVYKKKGIPVPVVAAPVVAAVASSSDVATTTVTENVKASSKPVQSSKASQKQQQQRPRKEKKTNIVKRLHTGRIFPTAEQRQREQKLKLKQQRKTPRQRYSSQERKEPPKSSERGNGHGHGPGDEQHSIKEGEQEFLWTENSEAHQELEPEIMQLIERPKFIQEPESSPEDLESSKKLEEDKCILNVFENQQDRELMESERRSPEALGIPGDTANASANISANIIANANANLSANISANATANATANANPTANPTATAARLNPTANPTPAPGAQYYAKQSSAAMTMMTTKPSTARTARIITHTDDESGSIGKGIFRWEWENPTTAKANQKLAAAVAATSKSNSNSNDANSTKVQKQIPRNYGKRCPQSWEEAYAMIEEFKLTEGHCAISKTHPLLGKFTTKLRKEHIKFREHVREQRSKHVKTKTLGAVYRKVAYNNARRDMTRVDWRRVKQLNSIGFKLNTRQDIDDAGKIAIASHKNNGDRRDSLSSDSETDTEDEVDDDDDDDDDLFDKFRESLDDSDDDSDHDDEACLFTVDSDDEVDYKSGDDSSDDDDDDDLNDDDDGNSKKKSKMISGVDVGVGVGLGRLTNINQSSSRSVDGGDNEGTELLSLLNKKNSEILSVVPDDEVILNETVVDAEVHDKGIFALDHAKDDDFLIVQNLEDICLADTCTTNKEIVAAGKPTLPIELYRLLRLSTLHPELGLDKAIRWTEDGNGFHIVDESLFFQKIVTKTSNMNKIISFRNGLGQFNFVSIEIGHNKQGSACRTYQHRSIAKAKEANDPSLRLFYRGLPLDAIRTIKTRKEERNEQERQNEEERQSRKSTTENATAYKKNNSSENNNKRKRDAVIEPVWKDEEYKFANASNGERMSSSGRRIMSVDRTIWMLGNVNGVGEDDRNDNDKGNCNRNDSRGRQRRSNNHPKNQFKSAYKKEVKGESRTSDRARRRTSDGCLLPKGGAEQLLLEDGTYEKPQGPQPNGLFWDEIRGFWAPPHLLTKSSESGSFPLKKRRKRSNSRDYSSEGDNINVHEQDDSRFNEDMCKSGWQLGGRTKARRTSDGCLLPKREPVQNDDGTYVKPKGHEPQNLKWDEIRGLWVPRRSNKKRKTGIGRSSPSLSSRSSSSDDDAMVIKASNAKLFHHSSFMWRTFFQSKKQSRHHQKRFQARTKSNPSGIISQRINKSNWGKIEKLMQLSTQRSSADAVTAKITTAYSDDGDEELV